MSYYSPRRSPNKSLEIGQPCEFCGKIFDPAKGNARFCSRKCYDAWRIAPKESKQEPAEPPKPLTDWIREAKECNLDYGTYRGLIEQGKTFDQLKALAPSRNPGIHSRSHRSPTYIH